MAKFQNDTMLDNAFSVITDNVTLLVVTDTQPITYTSAVGANLLARHVVSAADFTIGDGDTNGRKVTIAQQTSLIVSVTGNGNHVVLATSAALSTIYYVTTATSQTLTATNTLTVNAWDIEIADAT